MAYVFQIEGEITPYNYYDSPGYVTLKDVENHLAKAAGEEVTAEINCYGGDVEEGILMYQQLRKYAMKYKVPVTTYAKGRCDSIATVVFLAGDRRITNKFLEPFVHNAWSYSDIGDNKHFSRVAADLTATNLKIAKFYEEHTDLTLDEALALMDASTSISPEDAVAIRFATEIDVVERPAALTKFMTKRQNSNTNQNKYKMDSKNFLKDLAAALGISSGAKNSTVFTAAQEELDFPSVPDGESPKVGDKATINGEPANGEYELAGDMKYVFVDGELTEIITETEEETDEEKIARLETENSTLRADLEKAKNSSKSNKADSELAETKKELASIKSQFANLKSVVSKHVVSDKNNSTRTAGEEDNEKKGLGGSISKLREKKNQRSN